MSFLGDPLSPSSCTRLWEAGLGVRLCILRVGVTTRSSAKNTGNP